MTSNYLFLKDWLREHGELDMYDFAEELDMPFEISDENGWRIIESIWIEDDTIKGWTKDEYCKDHEEIIYLTEEEVNKIVNILKNGCKK